MSSSIETKGGSDGNDSSGHVGARGRSSGAIRADPLARPDRKEQLNDGDSSSDTGSSSCVKETKSVQDIENLRGNPMLSPLVATVNAASLRSGLAGRATGLTGSGATAAKQDIARESSDKSATVDNALTLQTAGFAGNLSVPGSESAGSARNLSMDGSESAGFARNLSMRGSDSAASAITQGLEGKEDAKEKGGSSLGAVLGEYMGSVLDPVFEWRMLRCDQDDMLTHYGHWSLFATFWSLCWILLFTVMEMWQELLLLQLADVFTLLYQMVFKQLFLILFGFVGWYVMTQHGGCGRIGVGLGILFYLPLRLILPSLLFSSFFTPLLLVNLIPWFYLTLAGLRKFIEMAYPLPAPEEANKEIPNLPFTS